MIRRVLLASAAVLFAAAAVSAGVLLLGICRLIIGMPDVGEGVRQVARLQPWGLAFGGCMLAGFVALWFVPDKDPQAAGEESTAADRPRE